MPLKEETAATTYEEVDRWEGGMGWLAHPEETMQRASHALVVDDEVWVVDPVEAPGIDEAFAAFGPVAGVVVTMDRHARDAARIAGRHGVHVHVPEWVAGSVSISGPVERFQGELADTGFRALKVLDVPGWHEAALYDHRTGTLVVGEAVGTADYFLAGAERLGVHPMLRLTPPTVFRGLEPARILVGHGAGVSTDATGALIDALAGSRRRFPALLVQTVRQFLPGGSQT